MFAKFHICDHLLPRAFASLVRTWHSRLCDNLEGQFNVAGAMNNRPLTKASISRGETAQKKRLYLSVTVFSTEILMKDSVFTSPK